MKGTSRGEAEHVREHTFDGAVAAGVDLVPLQIECHTVVPDTRDKNARKKKRRVSENIDRGSIELQKEVISAATRT